MSVIAEKYVGYGKLESILDQALDQAAIGKGKERHATVYPFHEQPIIKIAELVGEGYQLGQAIKKLQESQRLPLDMAIAERLGAINYIAASIITLQKGQLFSRSEDSSNTLPDPAQYLKVDCTKCINHHIFGTVKQDVCKKCATGDLQFEEVSCRECTYDGNRLCLTCQGHARFKRKEEK